MAYTPNAWTDGVTAVNATRLTKVESELSYLDDAVDGTTTGLANRLLMLDGSGRATIADAIADTQAASLGQVKAAVASGGGLIKTVVRAKLATQPSTTSGSVWTLIPDLQMTGLNTGDKVTGRLRLKYRGASGGSVGGIQVRFKGNTSAVTNKLGNPSFEVDTTNWTSTGLTTLTRDTSLGGQDGSANLKAAISGTNASQQIWSEWVAVTPGQGVSGGFYARRVSATARTVRADIQYQDVSGNLLAGTLGGAGVTPTTSGWTRAIVDGTHGGPSVAPTGAVAARLRMAILSVAAGDEFHFDAAQLEFTDPLPTYGSTGGGGSAALDIDAEVYALALAATSSDTGYTRAKSIRTAASATVTVSAGALPSEDTIMVIDFDDITVAGTGLTNQTIAFEFAQIADSATATQLVSGSAMFVLEEQGPA